MIPALDPATGNLPPGRHDASLEEVAIRYGTTMRRQLLLAGLREAIAVLEAAGCRYLYLNGSFVSAKEEPGDYDVCWESDEVDLFQLLRTAEALMEYRPERRGPRQKERFGGDFFALPPVGAIGRDMLDVFQRDTITGAPKGIIRLRLGDHDDRE